MIPGVLNGLGLEPRRAGPRFDLICPYCGERKAHCAPPVGGRPPMVFCNRRLKCDLGAREGVPLFTLLAERRGGSAEAIATLRALAGRPARSVAPAPPPPRARPPLAEVAALWNASDPVCRATFGAEPAADAGAEAAWALLRAKGSEPGDVAAFDLARLLPPPGAFPHPRWWPESWATEWCIAVPAYEPDGTLASIHARAAHADAEPKTRWPLGCGAAGLLFAGEHGRAFLRGDEELRRELSGVLIVEGLTDFLRASLWALEMRSRSTCLAVLGVAAGGAQAFAHVRWPAGLPCIVATDADRAGDTYAAAVQSALQSKALVERMVVGRG